MCAALWLDSATILQLRLHHAHRVARPLGLRLGLRLVQHRRGAVSRLCTPPPLREREAARAAASDRRSQLDRTGLPSRGVGHPRSTGPVATWFPSQHSEQPCLSNPSAAPRPFVVSPWMLEAGSEQAPLVFFATCIADGRDVDSDAASSKNICTSTTVHGCP